jgi:hypothetical protein
MKLKHSPVFLAIAVLILASLACNAATGQSTPVTSDGSTGEQAATAEPQAPAPTEEQKSAAPSVPPAEMQSSGPGTVCIGSQSGLTCLGADGWQAYNEDNSEIGSNYLVAGAVCPDGSFAVAHLNGISLFDGKSWKEVPAGDAYSSPEAVSCASDGSLWVAHFQGVSHFDGQWTTYGAENLASGESANELVYDVEAAPDGKVWVLTSRSVAVFESNAWTVYQEGSGFNESRFFNAMTLDVRGRPWAAHGNGVDVFENGAWQAIPLSDYITPESLTVDARGDTWIGTLSDGALQLSDGAWSKHSRNSDELSSDSVNATAADSGGRVWVGTSYGLSVFDGSGWQTYLMSNSGLTDNDVRFVLVTNDGPSLPAPEEKAKGSLTGTLKDASGSPLNGMRVEICVETLSSTFSGDTPCSDQPFFLFTQTDENGVFLIEDVPAGYYVIVAETGSGWAQLTDQFGISSERTFIDAGDNYDIGTLTLEK